MLRFPGKLYKTQDETNWKTWWERQTTSHTGEQRKEEYMRARTSSDRTSAVTTLGAVPGGKQYVSRERIFQLCISQLTSSRVPISKSLEDLVKNEPSTWTLDILWPLSVTFLSTSATHKRQAELKDHVWGRVEYNSVEMSVSVALVGDVTDGGGGVRCHYCSRHYRPTPFSFTWQKWTGYPI